MGGVGVSNVCLDSVVIGGVHFSRKAICSQTPHLTFTKFCSEMKNTNAFKVIGKFVKSFNFPNFGMFFQMNMFQPLNAIFSLDMHWILMQLGGMF